VLIEVALGDQLLAGLFLQQELGDSLMDDTSGKDSFSQYRVACRKLLQVFQQSHMDDLQSLPSSPKDRRPETDENAYETFRQTIKKSTDAMLSEHLKL
jgi:uncharacterized protein YutE (UPF0331/DUF86 family)